MGDDEGDDPRNRLRRCMERLWRSDTCGSGALELQNLLFSKKNSIFTDGSEAFSRDLARLVSRWIVESEGPLRSEHVKQEDVGYMCLLLGSLLRYLNRIEERDVLEIGTLSLLAVAAEGRSGHVRVSALDALAETMRLRDGINALSGIQWLQMMRKGPIVNKTEDMFKDVTNQFVRTLQLRTHGALALALEDEKSSVRLAAVKCCGVFAMSKLTICTHIRSARRFVRVVTDKITDIACYDSTDLVRCEALNVYSEMLRCPSIEVCCGLSIEQLSRLLNLLDDASISVRKAFVNLILHSNFETIDALAEMLGGVLQWLTQRYVYTTSTELSICLYLINSVMMCVIRNKDYMHQRTIQNRVSEHLLDVLDKPDLIFEAVLSVTSIATLASRGVGLGVDAMGYIPMSQVQSLSFSSLRVATAALVFMCTLNVKPILSGTLRSDLRRTMLAVRTRIAYNNSASSVELCRYSGPQHSTLSVVTSSAYWLAKPHLTTYDRPLSRNDPFDVSLDFLFRGGSFDLKDIFSEICIRLRLIPEDKSSHELVPEITHFATLQQSLSIISVGTNCIRVSGFMRFPSLMTIGFVFLPERFRLTMLFAPCRAEPRHRSIIQELGFEVDF
eukprot:g1602.t1